MKKQFNIGDLMVYSQILVYITAIDHYKFTTVRLNVIGHNGKLKVEDVWSIKTIEAHMCYGTIQHIPVCV